ncbi:uncharacterized protein MELLADRAFT_114001 [Melampsora larici-populina 98AG31]|uniref:Uncharacterized protein n=1 Tax=Melampsora larici-populina (strain 98AG31 / pathotype 3-4-7) TaxID=747676 RepID=F4SBT5_MELLP|nr:uncharacterized protein MELLADRAFT_114001 [Melampsora larici-populina 98AG31]EGF97885.1 hypothetical protein MELLADRAFT_114001 [Melampsora larici-populina 98AG31]
MDSESFHQQIDGTLRNEQEDGKGKGVENREEDQIEGTSGAREEKVEEEGGDDILEGGNHGQDEGKDTTNVNDQQQEQPTTRQSTRSKAPPKPFPPPAPPTVSKAKTIAPIRIKRLKQAEKIVQDQPTDSSQKKRKTGPTNQPNQQAFDNPPAPPVKSNQQPVGQIINELSEEESEDEDVQRRGLWEGTNREENRQMIRTVGGIVLGEADEVEAVERDQSKADNPTVDSVTQRLEEQITAAFERHDRVAYNKFTEEKRAWIEFKSKDKPTATTEPSAKTVLQWRILVFATQQSNESPNKTRFVITTTCSLIILMP